MAIAIKQTPQGIWVDNIFVYQDASGVWIADGELSTSQQKAFQSFLKAL